MYVFDSFVSIHKNRFQILALIETQMMEGLTEQRNWEIISTTLYATNLYAP